MRSRSRSPRPCAARRAATRRTRPSSRARGARGLGRRRAAESGGDRCRPAGRSLLGSARSWASRRGVAERPDQPQSVAGPAPPARSGRARRLGRSPSGQVPAVRRRAGRWCRRQAAAGRSFRRRPRSRRGNPASHRSRRRWSGTAGRPQAWRPWPARSDRFTATSFQPTLAGGSVRQEVNALGDACRG